MTVKEVEEKLTRMCKREYDFGNVAGGFAYDMAQLLVREIKDRSEEMIEFMKIRNNHWLNLDPPTPYQQGIKDCAANFLRWFQADDQLWIEGWDFNA